MSTLGEHQGHVRAGRPPTLETGFTVIPVIQTRRVPSSMEKPHVTALRLRAFRLVRHGRKRPVVPDRDHVDRGPSTSCDR